LLIKASKCYENSYDYTTALLERDIAPPSSTRLFIEALSAAFRRFYAAYLLVDLGTKIRDQSHPSFSYFAGRIGVSRLFVYAP